MPRNPPRKTTNGTFSEETMRRAVEAVLTGRSIRSVAKEEGLSFQTLARYDCEITTETVLLPFYYLQICY